jgi:LPS export ABC transporter protein LptC
MSAGARLRRGLPALLLALVACKEAPLGGSVALDATSNQVTVGMNLKLTEAGVLKADLYADTAVTPAGDTRSQLKRVRLTFFTPGKPPSHLTSRTGEYDQQNGQMIARGQVVLVTPGDKGMRTIRSEELFWNQKEDHVWSERETLITDGFTSNSAFTNVQGNNGRVKGVKVGEGGIRF